MNRMASKTRRIPKSLFLLVAIAIPVVILAVLLEPFLFPRAARVRAWSPTTKARAEANDIRPGFGESKTGAIPVLVLESRPMDPKARARRHRILHAKLAEARLGPLLFELQDLPGKSLKQLTAALDRLPSGCHVVLEISLPDLVLEARDPKSRPEPSAVLETHTGSFPAALWPLRRMGAPKETQRYDRVGATLLEWKQRIEANHGRLVLLYLPQPIECDPGQLAVELETLGLDSSQLQSNRAARRMQDLCRELKIPFVDPTRLLAGSLRNKRPLFDDVGAAPFAALYTERAENLILGRLARQGIQPLFK